MIPQQLEWFASTGFEAVHTVRSVLEFGSLDVNGSLRPLITERFKPSSYLGIDMRDGPGVDLVADMTGPIQWPEPADLVVCVNALEHVLDWKAAVRTLKRASAKWIAVAVPQPSYPYHDFPDDYWRWTASQLIDCFADRPLVALTDEWECVTMVVGGDVVLACGEVAK